jgi:hypothetical protein
VNDATREALDALMSKVDVDDCRPEIVGLIAEVYKEGIRDVCKCLDVPEGDIEEIVGVMVPDDLVERVLSMGEATRKGMLS